MKTNRPPMDWRATLEIGLDAGVAGGVPQATVNGQACRPLPGLIASHAAPAVFGYDVPVAALVDLDANRIAVGAPAGASVKLAHVEMRLAPD